MKIYWAMLGVLLSGFVKADEGGQNYSWDSLPNVVRTSQEINVQTGQSCRNWMDVCTAPVKNETGQIVGTGVCIQNPNNRRCPDSPSDDACEILTPLAEVPRSSAQLVFLESWNPPNCSETSDASKRCLCDVGRRGELVVNKAACERTQQLRSLKHRARVNCRQVRERIDEIIQNSSCNEVSECKRCARACNDITRLAGYDAQPSACVEGNTFFSFSDGQALVFYNVRAEVIE